MRMHLSKGKKKVARPRDRLSDETTVLNEPIEAHETGVTSDSERNSFLRDVELRSRDEEELQSARRKRSVVVVGVIFAFFFTIILVLSQPPNNGAPSSHVPSGNPESPTSSEERVDAGDGDEPVFQPEGTEQYSEHVPGNNQPEETGQSQTPSKSQPIEYSNEDTAKQVTATEKTSVEQHVSPPTTRDDEGVGKTNEEEDGNAPKSQQGEAPAASTTADDNQSADQSSPNRSGSPVGMVPTVPPAATEKSPSHLDFRDYSDAELRNTVWGLNLMKPPAKPVTNQGLVFIKGMKVGGTSVAMALNKAASHYHIKLARVSWERNRLQHSSLENCAMLRGALMYFSHGYKNTWQKQCMPHVRYVTVLRDPVWQQISFDAYTLNLDYFVNYPMEPCPDRQFIDARTILSDDELVSRLKTVDSCNDTPYRKNLTLIYVANRIRALPPNDPGTSVTNTYRWLADAATYQELTSDRIIDYVKKEYFLIGVTERINQFLVLLALANGWSFDSLYYRRCKPSNLDVSRQEFGVLQPELTAKLSKASRAADETYQWALRSFDEHIAKLGPWFQERLVEFEKGLKAFQASRTIPGSFKWREFKYADGNRDVC